MGQPKPLLRIDDRPLLAHVVELVRHARVAERIVVLGHEASRVRDQVPLTGVKVVVNPEYADGMSTSIRAGVRAASPASDAYLIVLGDQPFVESSTLDRVIASWEPGGPKILVPTFSGRRGNPVLIDRSLAGELERIEGDVGFRALFGDHLDDIREIPVDDPAVLVDLDRPEQVEAVSHGLASGQPLSAVLETLAVASSTPRLLTDGRSDSHPSRARTNVLRLATELDARGEPFVLATVVRVTRPTSGKVGNRAIIRRGQEIDGWVGGSCTESAVRAESVAALRDGKPRLLRLSKEPSLRGHEDGVVEYTMECHSGGTMDIYLEPHIAPAQLLIVGDSPIASALTSLGRFLDYHVTLVAPKATRELFPEADEVATDVNRVGALVKGETFAVVATMGKYDEAALRALAPSRASYVGLVASRRRAAAVREQLGKEGIPESALARIHNPAGIDLAALTPEEIALSIVAEITRSRRQEGPKEIPVMETASPAEPAETVLDVVCGMSVDPSTPLKTEYQGRMFSFCSEGCRTQFRESPQDFLR